MSSSKVDLKGRVLVVVEENGYDDSDWYATYAEDAEDGGYKFRRVLVGSTRFGGFDPMPKVDASHEMFTAYLAARKAAFDKYDAERAEDAAATPDKGKRVVVVGGRKYKGKMGHVFWRGEDQFRRGYGGYQPMRVGVKFDDGEKGFLPEDQVRVEGYEQFGVPSGPSLGYMRALMAAWPSVREPEMA